MARRDSPEVKASTAADARANASALGCSQRRPAAPIAMTAARPAVGLRSSRSVSASTASASGTDSMKLKKPRYSGALWNTVGAKTARRRSRPNAPRNIQNTAEVAIAISDNISLTAMTGPVSFAMPAAGR